MRLMVICMGMLFHFTCAYAGEADSADTALQKVADRIEAGDVEGALKYFSPDDKNTQAVRLITMESPESRRQFAVVFRNAKLKNTSQLNGYEGRQPGDEYHTYSTLMEDPQKGNRQMEIAVCGNRIKRDWYVCNW